MKSNLPISQWPESERPREKLLVKGADFLSDAELIAIFFRTGVRGKTALDLAREALNLHGSLQKLLEASLPLFSKSQGLGMAKYIQLQAALELGRRYCQTQIFEKDVFTDSQEIKQFLKAKFAGKRQEVFGCLFLNTRHHLIAYEELFQGTIDGAVIHPRIVIERAIFHNASAIIFCHNHPSGDPTPSHADKLMTQNMKKTLHAIDVRLLDHFVIGNSQIESLAERGEM